jgi:hypothetical protein
MPSGSTGILPKQPFADHEKGTEELGRNHNEYPEWGERKNDGRGSECRRRCNAEWVLPEDLRGCGRRYETCDDEELPGERWDDAQYQLGRGEEGPCRSEAALRKRMEEMELRL